MRYILAIIFFLVPSASYAAHLACYDKKGHVVKFHDYNEARNGIPRDSHDGFARHGEDITSSLMRFMETVADYEDCLNGKRKRK